MRLDRTPYRATCLGIVDLLKITDLTETPRFHQREIPLAKLLNLCIYTIHRIEIESRPFDDSILRQRVKIKCQDRITYPFGFVDTDKKRVEAKVRTVLLLCILPDIARLTLTGKDQLEKLITLQSRTHSDNRCKG